MEVNERMKFKTEDGSVVEFVVEAEIYLDEDTEKEKRYIILSPVEEQNSDSYIFRVDMEDNKEVLNFVEDEEEYKKVKKQYLDLLY